MNRLALLTAAAVFAVPASAQAATGVVLSVDRHHHALQLIDSAHHLRALRFGAAAHALKPGARVSYSGTKVARRLRVTGHGAARVSFLAHVVRSGRSGVVLRLADGQRASFAASQIKHRVAHHRTARRHRAVDAHAAGLTVNVLGLQPGDTVLVTESVDSSGNVTITITLPTRTNGSSAGNGGSTGGDPSGGDGSDPVSSDVTGTITAVSGAGLTVRGDDGNLRSFAVDDPSVTDGLSVGDAVDVSYEDLGDGTLDAVDVEFVQQDVTGTVTAVSDGSLTVTPADGTAPQTFTADPADGTFDGVAVGDPVDVTSHVAGGQTVVDNVNDGSGD